MNIIYLNEQQVRPVAFSPDGQFIVSGSESGAISIWNSTNGSEVWTVTASDAPVRSINFSPDGSRICSSACGGGITIWDTTTGTMLNTFDKYDNRETHVVFSPDDVHLISGHCDGRLCVWDSLNGKLQWTDEDAGQNLPTLNLAVAPDASLIASVSLARCEISLWRLATGEPRGTLAGHTDFAVGIAFLPDNQHLVSASWGEVIIWDTISKSMLHMFDAEQVEALAMSPDGSLLSLVTENSIFIHSTENFHRLQTLWGHTLAVNNMAFSPDNTSLVSSSVDDTLRIWDVSVSSLHLQLSNPDLEESNINLKHHVALARDGDRVVLAAIESTQICIWDLSSSSSPTKIHECHPIACVAVSTDGSLIAVAVREGEDGRATFRQICIWDAICFERLADVITQALGQEDPKADGEVVFSSDGSLVASNHVEGKAGIWVWKATTMEKVCEFRGRAAYFNFSNDATRLALMTFDIEIHLWDIQNQTMIKSVSPPGLEEGSLFFSPDDLFLFCLQAERCAVLDVATLEQIQDLESGLLIRFEQEPSAVAVPRFLKIDNEWLWEVDHAWKRKLCWLPPEYRQEFDRQLSWQGAHLAIALVDGNIVVLNIDLMRDRVPVPVLRMEE